jgi:predicted PurR-regulated permease PerM
MFLFGLFNPMLGYGLAVLLVFIISMPVFIFAAYLVTRIIDEPGTRLSRQIYERFFKGEPFVRDWNDARSKVVTFAKKNTMLLLVVELVLIFSLVGVVLIEKPIMDQNNANMEASNTKVAVFYYFEDLNKTINAYNNITIYPVFNNTSVGSYSVWLNGYGNLTYFFTADYNAFKYNSESNQHYFNMSMQEKMAHDISYYGGLVNMSNNQTVVYENTYNAWYWNNTPPVSVG